MPPWLVSLLMPFVSAIISMWESELISWVKGLIAKWKQQKVDAQNVETQKKASESGDLNAISQAGADTLNGTAPVVQDAGKH